MTTKIEAEPTPNPCLEEETAGGEITPEPAPQGSGWSDVVETARAAGRWVRGAVDEAKAALDLEGRIEALGPDDRIRLRASMGVQVVGGVSMGEALEVRRLSDGRYLVAGSAELGLSFSQKLQGGSQTLSALGFEQSGGGRAEFTCQTAAEAADATRALRNAHLRQLGVPAGDSAAETVLLASKLSAVELSGSGRASLDARLNLGSPGLELKAGLRSEQAARVEFSPQGEVLVLRNTVTADGGAPARLKDLLPRTGPKLPPQAALSLGPPLRGTVQVENETRIPLQADVAEALAQATTKVTFSGESRVSAGVAATGREAKLSFTVSAAQAKDVLQGFALGDAGRLAAALEVEATLEVRPYQDLGGDASFGLSGGTVGGSVGLEARLRDVQHRRGVKVSGSAGALLRWLAE